MAAKLPKKPRIDLVLLWVNVNKNIQHVCFHYNAFKPIHSPHNMPVNNNSWCLNKGFLSSSDVKQSRPQ